MFPATIFGLLGKLLESFGIWSDFFLIFLEVCATWIDADLGSKVVFDGVVEAFRCNGEVAGSANATRATVGDGLDREKMLKAGCSVLALTVMLSEAETSDCPHPVTVFSRQHRTYHACARIQLPGDYGQILRQAQNDIPLREC